MTVMTSAPDLTVLTDKQRAATDAVLAALRSLERTSFPDERTPIINQILRGGVALKTIVDKLETQLITFDGALRERGTSEEEDDLWIQNLSRWTTMQRVLDLAKSVI